MQSLHFFRNKAFKIVDFLSGKPFSKAYKELQLVLEQQNADEALQIRQRNLANLFSHATTFVPFYKEFKEAKTLTDFPVISKNVVQDNFEAFKSDNFSEVNKHQVATSGSTGRPFFLFQDQHKRNRNRADVWYFLEQAGHKIGERIYELEVWRNHNRKNRVKAMLQNIVQFDVSKMSDDRIEELLNQLKKDKQPKTLLGFASALDAVCKYLDVHKIRVNNLNIKAIIANSEYLTPYTRNALEKHFQVPVFSRYSNEELGIIAHQTLHSNGEFAVNWGSYHVEVLEFNSDTPVREGALGRIVVTDLFNYCMPLIRYDTGDIGCFTQHKDKTLQNFKHIEGRKMDLIFDTSGNVVSSFVVYTKFYKYYHLLKQYQFIQKGPKQYCIKLNTNNFFSYEAELIQSIKDDFGADADVTIEYVKEIPPLSSGKRKKVVNTFHK